MEVISACDGFVNAYANHTVLLYLLAGKMQPVTGDFCAQKLQEQINIGVDEDEGLR